MLILLFLAHATSLPVYTGNFKIDSATDTLLYLSKYGYIHHGAVDTLMNPLSGSLNLKPVSGSLNLKPRIGSVLTPDDSDLQVLLAKAISEFQGFSGIPVSGEIDPATLEQMKKPRCGVKDMIGFGSRFKRYVLQGSRWKKNNLTYHISKYPRTKRMTKKTVDIEVSKSFKVWSDVSELTFHPFNSVLVDIEIRFDRYEHGDGDDFDGVGGTLGHAFFPEFGGDIHLDDSEFWTMDLDVGTNLKFSLVHEIGHSLGLTHSNVPGAIMAPFYQKYKEDLSLHRDDILGIRELYGNYNRKIEGRINVGSDVSLCEDHGFDTLITTADLKTFVFRGDYYWRVEDHGLISDEEPRVIEEGWPGLESNIDAGFTTFDDNITYILKGDRVWRYRNQEYISGGSVPLSSVFPGVPRDVDAAFVWSGNGKIYFIKGEEYWKFDKERDPPVRSYFPISTVTWSLPPGIKTALQWKNKRTYFFTDTDYYRFNDFEFKIAVDHPPYPRPISTWWFGCLE